MITVLRTVNKKLVKGGIKDIKKGCWIDCLNPSKNELDEVSKKTKIRKNDLLLGLDEDERPKAIEADNYSIIIFKAPFFREHEVKTASFGIIITKDIIITVRKDTVKAIDEISEYAEEKKVTILKNGADGVLYEVISRVLNNYFSVLEDIEDRIEYIEHAVVKNVNKSLLLRIFEIKKTLIYFHKSLNTNREVIMEIEKEYVKNIPKKGLKKYRQCYYDITELIDLGSIHQDIMTGTLDVYLSSISNNLNDIMKRITAYGALILVPTLISGIYGMNFKIMPELYWKYGYAFALGLMVISVLSMYIYFKKEEWL